MSEAGALVVPTWVISGGTGGGLADVTSAWPREGMTPERLTQLRSALAAFADTPLMTLEAYPIAEGMPALKGAVVQASAPLAMNLTSLIQHSSRSLSASAPQAAQAISGSGDTLYRMVVPAAMAARMGAGLARAMPSAAASGGVHSGILSSAGIVGQATFVPVAAQAGLTTAGGAAATIGAAGLITVGAPLVLLSMATAATIYTEEQRRRALARMEKALAELKQQRLNEERDALNAASRSLAAATTLLLDEGRIGPSLGLDSAVHSIETGVEAAARSIARWKDSIASLRGSAVTPSRLEKEFPGIEKTSGEFRARLRMAAFALSMKQRVAVLQAVEHAQRSPDSPLARFASYLEAEQSRVSSLESDISEFLRDLSHLEIRPPTGIMDRIMTRGEVKDLLKWPSRLRELEEREGPKTGPAGDMELGIVRHRSGALTLVAPHKAG